MPKIKIYIRNDDMGKWNAIQKKSEFISASLNYVPPTYKEDPPAVKERKEALSVLQDILVDKTADFCIHGAAREYCAHAKVKNGVKKCRL